MIYKKLMYINIIYTDVSEYNILVSLHTYNNNMENKDSFLC